MSEQETLHGTEWAAEQLDVCVAKVRTFCKDGALGHFNYGTEKKPWYRFNQKHIDEFKKKRMA